MTSTHLEKIEGDRAVEAVTVTGPSGHSTRIACDGVILTGTFTPDAALARCGHLAVDPGTGGPVVDQWGRCSDPAFFATGNVLRAVETAGRSWADGRQTGAWVAQDLTHGLPDATVKTSLQIALDDDRLKYAVPQRIGQDVTAGGAAHVQMRVRAPVSGVLVARVDGQPIWHKKLKARPERRIHVPIACLGKHRDAANVVFRIEDWAP